MFICLTVLYWAFTVQPRLDSFLIVVFNIITQLLLKVFHRLEVLKIKEFRLEKTEEVQSLTFCNETHTVADVAAAEAAKADIVATEEHVVRDAVVDMQKLALDKWKRRVKSK